MDASSSRIQNKHIISKTGGKVIAPQRRKVSATVNCQLCMFFFGKAKISFVSPDFLQNNLDLAACLSTSIIPCFLQSFFDCNMWLIILYSTDGTIVSNYKLQITNYKLQITNYKFEIINLKLQISNYKFEITNLKFQIWNYKLLVWFMIWKHIAVFRRKSNFFRHVFHLVWNILWRFWIDSWHCGCFIFQNK
jgi:hypothetical protein